MTNSGFDRLREALRDRADQVRPADVRERALRTSRRLRRRLRFTSAAAVIVALGLSAATAAWVPWGGGPPPTGAPQRAATRFILTGGNVIWPGESGQKLIDVIPEVLPDGTLRILPKPAGLEPPLTTVSLPDGRLAVLGRVAAGSEAMRLVIVGADGTVTVSRDLPADAGFPAAPWLSGASNTEVYFMRGPVLVAHDIATGVEREVRRGKPGSVPAPYSATANASQVAVWPGLESRRTPTGEPEKGSCAFAILDPRTGQEVKLLRAPVDWCSPSTIRLSPDGKRAVARVVQISGLRSSEWLFIFDVTTGAVLRTYTIEENQPAGRTGGTAWSFSEYGWIDRDTVRYVTATVPIGDVDALAKSLDIRTFTV